MTDFTAEIIPFETPEAQGRETAIKWSLNNARYEIYATELEDLDPAQLMAHCITISDRIRQLVDREQHVAPSLFQVFPRTISTVLRSVWDNIADEHPKTSEGYDECLKEFIASNCSTSDRHELVHQLRNARKPRKMKVSTFLFRLLTLNGYVQWMPGQEPPLNASQLKQAFHDAMPRAWKLRFIDAGKSVVNEPLQEMKRYFIDQENSALKRQHDNERAQRRLPRNLANRSKSNNGGKRGHQGQNNRREGAKKPKMAGNQVADDEKCPIHPNSDHLFGDCAKHPDPAKAKANMDRLKAKGNKKGKANGFSVLSAPKPSDSPSSHTTTIKMEDDDSTVTDIAMADAMEEAMGDLNVQDIEQLLNDVPTTGKFEIELPEAYAFSLPLSHHVENSNFSQAAKTEFFELARDEIATNYMSFMTELFEKGLDDNEKEIKK